MHIQTRLIVRPLVPKEYGKSWTAEPNPLIGSPIIGRGNTWLEAIGDYCLQTGALGVKVLKKDGKPQPQSFFGPYYRRD